MARDSELVARAKAAAERLFDAPGETGDIFEPYDRHTAKAAVRRFSELFAGLRGVPKSVMESARNSGRALSD